MKIISKWLSLAVVLFPLLSVYSSIIPGVEFGTFLLLTVIFIIAIVRKKIELKRLPVSVFGNYVLFASIVGYIFVCVCNYTTGVDATTVIFRIARFTLILFLFFSCGIYKYIDKDCLCKYLRIAVIGNAIFIIIQYIVFYFGIILTNPLLDFNFRGYSDFYIYLHRPSGFFLEPSHFAQYAIVYMIICFNLNRKNFFEICITYAGVMMSTSGMGIVLANLLIIYYYVIKNKSNLRYPVLILYSAFLLYFLQSNNKLILMLYERIFTAGGVYGGNAIDGRMGHGIDSFFNLPLLLKICGCGYGNEPMIYTGDSLFFYNGFTYTINTLGIVGLCAFIGLNIYYLFTTNALGRSLIVINLFFFFLDQNLTATNLVFIFGIIYSFSNNNNQLEFEKKRRIKFVFGKRRTKCLV